MLPASIQRYRLLTLISLFAAVGLFVYAVVRAAQAGVHLRSGSISGQVGDVLGFALFCGVLAAATVEIVKRFSSARASFQLALVRAWLEARRPEFLDRPDSSLRELFDAMGLRRGPEEGRGWAEPIGDLDSVFALPPDELLAQIATAVDATLAEPGRYEGLLASVLGREPRFEEARDRPAGEADLRLNLADAQRLRAALDNLQTELTQRWRRIIQGFAIWIAGVYGVVASFAGGLSGANQARYLFAALVLGGPIAWIVRDLTAVIERLRR
jgi:hypothetical protein